MATPPQYMTGLGKTKTVYVSTFTDQQFESREALRLHNRQYQTRLRKDFANLVREGKLKVSPWERLPGESPIEYSRFRIYLGMVERSHTKVATVIGVQPGEILRIMSKWSWKHRVELWDREIERQELAEFHAERLHSARKQAKVGQALQKLALRGAQAYLDNDDKIEEMTGNEIAKLADVGVKIERLANSDPTSINEDRGITLLWEGPRPDWAPDDSAQLGPLATKVIEGQR